MTLLDRHLGFLDALRRAGLPVSLAEGLDAVRAVEALGLADRDTLREGYAAALVKRHAHRQAFDRVFDLFFPALVGEGAQTDDAGATPATEDAAADETAADGPQALADFRERLSGALAGEPDLLVALAREAVQRFGRIPGRGPGEQRWSSYNVLNRVAPDELVQQLLAGMADGGRGPSLRQAQGTAAGSGIGRPADVQRRARDFARLVEDDVARRASEVRGAEHVARHTVRRSIDQVDFLSARREDLEQMRREVWPLARRLATRVSRHQRARRGGPLDFRRTVRASLSSGGVPLTTRHRPRRPGRTDLVVLCDVSGSVANFAGFTLLLVFALREQFQRVRAFTFVDDVHEVTDRFTVGADPAETLAALAASAEHASLWGRTSYGRAFTRFHEEYGDALTPRTNLLVLGDARSNYSDLALPVLGQMVHEARHGWWLNPEHRRHWDTGDSAAGKYAEVMPMVECRNLTQLGDFVRQLG